MCLKNKHKFRSSISVLFIFILYSNSLLRKEKWKSIQVTKCFSLGNSNVGVGGGVVEEPQRRRINHALKTVVLQICTIKLKAMCALGLL